MCKSRRVLCYFRNNTCKTPECRSGTFRVQGFRVCFSLFFSFFLLFLYSGAQNLFFFPQLLHDFLVRRAVAGEVNEQT